MSVADASSLSRPVADEPSAVTRLAAWFTVADHARLGRLYLGLTGVWLLLAAVLGALLGAERMDAGAALVDTGAHVQLFGLYHYALVLGVLAPLFLGVALLVVPSLLKAVDELHLFPETDDPREARDQVREETVAAALELLLTML